MKIKKESILVVAAHPDDEVLGCGGTIAKLCEKKKNVNIIFISNGVHRNEFQNENELSELMLKYKVKINYFQSELTW